LVSGGVSRCGDKNVPSYFTRLDYPEIATFIADPENKAATGNMNITVNQCFSTIW